MVNQGVSKFLKRMVWDTLIFKSNLMPKKEAKYPILQGGKE
jgi:hypothetical protein